MQALKSIQAQVAKMNEDIITVRDLKKVFRVHIKEEEGIISSLKLLFKREYKNITAVDNLSMRVKNGEIRGLIGPNGAGKSTTIKMLSGILFPTEGSVDVMGFTPWLEREEYVRHIGVVLGQKSQLLWDLPPSDSFLLNKQMYKIHNETFKKNLDYFKQILDIHEVVKRPVRNLSLGERMKCELVCAMLHDPKLVYLDEPTIGLDVFAKDSIRTFIKNINREKKVTFILTTHDLDDIENLCENITIINKGTIAYDDSIETLKKYYSNKKTIEIKFSRPVNVDELSQFNVIEGNPGSAKIQIDLSQSDLQGEVYKILSVFPVQDINIESIGIDEVIKQVYSQ